MLVSAHRVRRQILNVLHAWGMPADLADSTAEAMAETDLTSVDRHGISMLMMYEGLRRAGQIDLRARPCVLRDMPSLALVDSGGNLGHPVAAAAMGLAADKALATGNLFFWPWMGPVQGPQQAGSPAVARGPSGMEEVIPPGEEVLEVSKRTENRGTARVRRYVVETPVERQVTLLSEKVVVERRRPASDEVTGEVLTEMTVEVIETAEVPVVGKRARLREEVVVRTERAQRVETVRETVRRDEVEIQQPGRQRGSQQLRSAAAER